MRKLICRLFGLVEPVKKEKIVEYTHYIYGEWTYPNSSNYVMPEFKATDDPNTFFEKCRIINCSNLELNIELEYNPNCCVWVLKKYVHVLRNDCATNKELDILQKEVIR